MDTDSPYDLGEYDPLGPSWRLGVGMAEIAAIRGGNAQRLLGGIAAPILRRTIMLHCAAAAP